MAGSGNNAKRKWVVAAVALAVASAGFSPAAFAQDAKAPAKQGGANSDTGFVRQLLGLKQDSQLDALQKSAKGTPVENLYNAAIIQRDWDKLVRDTNPTDVATRYDKAITAYLDGTPANIDGGWALESAKFIFFTSGTSITNRMELWGNSRRDRVAVKPMIDLANRLLDTATTAFKARMSVLENQPNMDDKEYEAAYGANAEAEYYKGWGAYYGALATDPADPGRGKLLDAAIAAMKQWAEGDEGTGVKYQALLVRGKSYMEAGKFTEARTDLEAAENPKAPAPTQLQARYQMVVAQTRAKEFDDALKELERFKKWSATQPGAAGSAAVGLEMLRYRVEEARAEAMPEGDEKAAAENRALDILSALITKNPKAQDLIYQQLASQVPDNADAKALPPMKALAIAWTRAQSTDKADAKAAFEAAKRVHDDPAAGAVAKREATFLAGISAQNAGLDYDSAKMNVEFATGNPKDPRAKDLIDMALGQLSKLRKYQAVEPAELNPMILKALDLAVNTYHENNLQAAYATELIKNGGDTDATTKAMALLQNVKPTDKNYLDAQYQLVSISLDRLGKLVTAKAPIEEQTRAAGDVLSSTDRVIRLVDDPTVPEEARKRAAAYRTNLLLIQTATALNPLKALDRAKADIALLEKEMKKPGSTVTPEMRGQILKYKIAANANNAEDQLKVIDEFRAQNPSEGNALLKGMIGELDKDIDTYEKQGDTEQAKSTAANAATLMQALIKEAQKDSPQDVYGYQQLLGMTMIRAGQGKESQALFEDLEKSEKGKKDIFNFIGEAKARFAQGDFARAKYILVRSVQQLPEGSEGYWEAYYELFKCNDALGGPVNAAENKQKLKDLKGLYDDQLGGKRLKQEYRDLLLKYGVGDQGSATANPS